MYNGFSGENNIINYINSTPRDEDFLSNQIRIPSFIDKIPSDSDDSNQNEIEPNVIHNISSDGDTENLNVGNNIISNNNINSIYDFENIELPKEEDIGEFRVISSMTVTPIQKINSLESSSSGSEDGSDNSDIKVNVWDFLKKIVISKNYFNEKKSSIFKSLIFSAYYNNSTFKEKLTKSNSCFPVYIFDLMVDGVFNLNLNNTINFFIYMSYRSGFINLNNFGLKDISSDCGWGCMLRCCQMMLSRGIIKLKLTELVLNKKEISIDDMKKIRNDVLQLFYDGYINYNCVKTNLFLLKFWGLYYELADVNGASTKIYKYIPPFSIFSLCILGKCEGVYNSDVKMINCIVKISKLFFDYMKIVHFENGYIQKILLFHAFCEKIENDNINNKEKFFEFQKEKYIFKKRGIIFISLRLGLQNIDKSYYNIIPKLFFKLRNNIGFVCGKKKKAFYFIGCNGNGKLIFVDPHLNQKIENFNDKTEMLSYNITDLYLLDISELSSELTIGVSISNYDDLNLLLEDLKYFSETYPNFIIFK